MNKKTIIIYSIFVNENFFKKPYKLKRPFSVKLSTIQHHIDSKYIKLNIKRFL